MPLNSRLKCFRNKFDIQFTNLRSSIPTLLYHKHNTTTAAWRWHRAWSGNQNCRGQSYTLFPVWLQRYSTVKELICGIGWSFQKRVLISVFIHWPVYTVDLNLCSHFIICGCSRPAINQSNHVRVLIKLFDGLTVCLTTCYLLRTLHRHSLCLTRFFNKARQTSGCCWG